MEQSFTVPLGATSVVLSFDMFRNDWGSNPIVDPAGPDHTVVPNQHARVAIMTTLAWSFSTALADVVADVVAPRADGGANPNAYTSYLVDITAFVTAGATYKLRFGEVDNLTLFNQGVDNVSILAETAAVPEPATLGLLGLGLVGLAFAGCRPRA